MFFGVLSKERRGVDLDAAAVRKFIRQLLQQKEEFVNIIRIGIQAQDQPDTGIMKSMQVLKYLSERRGSVCRDSRRYISLAYIVFFFSSIKFLSVLKLSFSADCFKNIFISAP